MRHSRENRHDQPDQETKEQPISVETIDRIVAAVAVQVHGLRRAKLRRIHLNWVYLGEAPLPGIVCPIDRVIQAGHAAAVIARETLLGVIVLQLIRPIAVEYAT